METEIRLLRSDDLEQAWEVDRKVFHGDAGMRDVWMRTMSPERMHGAFDAGRLVALVATLPFGQYWGGRCVPMGGLSSVAVEPEYRGRGLASRVIHAAIDVMNERGEVLSALYPGSTALYRGLGWELAGAYVRRELRARVLLALPRPGPGSVRRAERAEVPDLQRCYEQAARHVNGFLARDASRWWRVTDRWDDHFVYTVPGGDDELAGYVVYAQLPRRPGEDAYGIQLIELVARERAAAEALWWTVGSSASQVERVIYTSSPEDPLQLLLPEQEACVDGEIRWMLRVNDAPGAVAQRGFPESLSLEVELLLGQQPGVLSAESLGGALPYVLSVSKGEGRLEPGGGGEIALGPGGFASLYSGWATPSRLADAGLLAGGSAESRARLASAFAGPTPYLLEEF